MSFANDSKDEKSNSKENIKAGATTNDDSPPASSSPPRKENWGYDLYPERRGELKINWAHSVFGRVGREPMQKLRCEKNVYRCIRSSTYVQSFK